MEVSMLRAGMGLVAVLLVVGWLSPTASAATCSDYVNQAQAQRAKDTHDADGDGIYCESLPCPCLKPGESGGGSGGPSPARKPKPKASCVRRSRVQRLVFSKTKYPHIRLHVLAAVKRGWPRIMVLNRKGADARRKRLLEGIPTRPGYDRDEYPADVGRGRANGHQRGLIRGINPVGWMADVAYVPSSENRSQGASLGAKLKPFCDGTKFTYAFV
jgi:hypothetical protein